MTTQTALMAALFLISALAALDWSLRGEYLNAMAFFCFGLGDLALAWASFLHGSHP